MKTDDILRDYREIKDDYSFDPDIMNREDPRVRAVKKVIQERLTEPDRIIITLYFELQSYRKLGARLGLSHMTAGREVRRIRGVILQEVREILEND